MLANCFVIDGHRAADGDNPDAAATAYLKSLALGCDLGQGTSSMSIVAIGSVQLGLEALTRLVTRSDDRNLLTRISGELSNVERRLPDLRAALRRERLWLENFIADAALSPEDADLKRSAAHLTVSAPFAAWHLWREQGILREFDSLTTVTDRNDATRIAESLERRSDGSSNRLIREMNLGREGLLRVSAIELAGAHRAAQAAVALQEWRIAHGAYPADAAVLRLPLNRDGLTYEPTGEGIGYKLIGPRSTLVETPSR